MFKDDARGVGEALNETDSQGRGERVKLAMKLVLEGKDRWIDGNLPWVKKAQIELNTKVLIGYSEQINSNKRVLESIPLDPKDLVVYYYPES